MSTCDCATLKPLELTRESIRRRVKESRAIKHRLVELAESEKFGLTLFRCRMCEQLWQSGSACNFAYDWYVFQVPPIDVVEWLDESFQQPAHLAGYSVSMAKYESEASFALSQAMCKVPDCKEYAVRNSSHCRSHHIASMQNAGALPKKPFGRVFDPYRYGMTYR